MEGLYKIAAHRFEAPPLRPYGESGHDKLFNLRSLAVIRECFRGEDKQNITNDS